MSIAHERAGGEFRGLADDGEALVLHLLGNQVAEQRQVNASEPRGRGARASMAALFSSRPHLTPTPQALRSTPRRTARHREAHTQPARPASPAAASTTCAALSLSDGVDLTIVFLYAHLMSRTAHQAVDAGPQPQYGRAT